MEKDKKLLSPMKSPEVIEAELRMRIPGALRAVENLEKLKQVSRETLELVIDV